VSRPVVAAFDFDGTLTRSDSVVPFLKRMSGGYPRLVGALIRRATRIVPAAARRDRDRLKQLATEGVLRGVPSSRIAAVADAHAAAIVERGLRDDTVARLRWHVDAAHLVVIVSASYENYVRGVAHQLGATDVIATRLEIGADGRCTGRLLGDNCRGAEKLRRLDAWLAERELGRSEIELWAYGDSAGDRELLDAADHPVWAKQPLDSVAPASA
jgi:phosphatidylglycerophosphatase C